MLKIAAIDEKELKYQKRGPSSLGGDWKLCKITGKLERSSTHMPVAWSTA